MKGRPSATTAGSSLRRRAESRLREQTGPPGAGGGTTRSAADTQRLLHELQVHQIELEMQNEELQRARDEMEEGLEKFSDLYDFAPVGYFTFTSTGLIRQVNLTGAGLVGVERSALVGQAFGRLVSPDLRPAFDSFLERVFSSATKHSSDLALSRPSLSPRFVSIEALRSTNGQECRAVVMDITARRRAAAQLELLWEAAGVLLSMDDPGRILRGLSATIGPAVGIDAFLYHAVDETGVTLRLASSAGISAEGARTKERMELGQGICGTVALNRQPLHADRVQRSVDPKLRAVKALGFRAFACNPLVSGDDLLGTLSFASRSRDQFDPDELAVLRTISFYVAVAYERFRVADALRASEERYRNLFNSIDEGFCVIEMAFDARRKATDYRFLEVNPAFEAQTGIRDAVGKRAREIAPKLEAHWFESYGRVAKTGEPVRFANEAKELGRWFDIYAFRLGGEGSRRVAVLLRDITAKKQAEEALHAAQERLVGYAEGLEVMVGKRTAELTRTNGRLRSAVQAVGKGKSKFRRLFLEAQSLQEKLRQLTHQVIGAQEEERKEISRELHDGVVQMLIGINVELATVSRSIPVGQGGLKKSLARTQRLVNESVRAVHQLAREMRPAVLDDLGLIPAIRAYGRNLAKRTKLEIEVTPLQGVQALDGARRTVLYRVAQEALTNVVRHAHATRVHIGFRKMAGGIRMEIRDDGRAFQVGKQLGAKNSARLGLVGMRERVEMVGGKLTLESTPGIGTMVRTDVPFATGKKA